MKLDTIKEQRGLDFLKKGMKVEFTYCGSKFGIIKGGNSSGNIDVLFEGSKVAENCHPKWCIRYFDDDGNVIDEFGVI